MPDWFERNFTRREVECPCCHAEDMQPETMARFQKARDILGSPLYGNSWFRCPKHNKKVGGTEDSSHLVGRAGDVTLAKFRAMRPDEYWRLLDALLLAGFPRLVLDTARRYIHADDDPDKPKPGIWFRRRP